MSGSSRASSSSVISALTYGRRSPITTTCETYGELFSRFSRFAGATFLPPAVIRMSFLRSVIVTKPSASIAGDVARAEPAVVVQHRARRLGILEVALEDRLAADQQLVVLAEAELRSGERRADGAEAVVVGPVHRRGRRALGEAVALEDQDVERVEELRHLLRERSAAGDADAEPPAEARLDLRVDEPGGEPVLRRERGRDRPVCDLQRAHATADARRPSRSAAA